MQYKYGTTSTTGKSWDAVNVRPYGLKTYQMLSDRKVQLIEDKSVRIYDPVKPYLDKTHDVVVDAWIENGDAERPVFGFKLVPFTSATVLVGPLTMGFSVTINDSDDKLDFDPDYHHSMVVDVKGFLKDSVIQTWPLVSNPALIQFSGLITGNIDRITGPINLRIAVGFKFEGGSVFTSDCFATISYWFENVAERLSLASST